MFMISASHRAKPAPPSPRTSELSLRFGLCADLTPQMVLPPTPIELRDGSLVLLLGSSGAGKSSALDSMERQCPGAIRVERVRFPADAAIIDHVMPEGSLEEAVQWLTACGLSEPRLWLRRFQELSEGERFRAQLACALAQHARAGAHTPLLCDDFAAALHTRAARAVSFNLHKLVQRHGLRVVLATTRDDLINELSPGLLVRLRLGDPPRTQQRCVTPRAWRPWISRLTIMPGTKRDYDAFAPMHYRAAEELGFVDKVFVVRERGSAGEVLGIVVYAHGPLELALRNAATGGYFVKRPDRLNREVRMLRRLVIHPDVRGCGVGPWLVRRTLPLVGVRFVECLAGMGMFHPVFERAGMRRIGQCAIPARCRMAMDELNRLDVHPGAPDFPRQAARHRTVRGIVQRVVREWYASLTAGGDRRVAHQSIEALVRTFRALIASAPVYYLWERGRRADHQAAPPLVNGEISRRRRRLVKTGLQRNPLHAPPGLRIPIHEQ